LIGGTFLLSLKKIRKKEKKVLTAHYIFDKNTTSLASNNESAKVMRSLKTE